MPQPSPNIETTGQFEAEADAEKAFDESIEACQCFSVEREVWGRHIIAVKAGECIGKKFRIDRLLIPNERFINHGWTAGPIGIEIKKSNVKIGKPISQILDYKSAIFQSKKLGYARILPTYIFLFPMGRVHGDVASILAQNQIGGIEHRNGYKNELVARVGEVSLFSIDINTGTIDINKNAFRTGYKNGSR